MVTRRTILQRLLLMVGINPAGLGGCVSQRGTHPVSGPVAAVVDPPSEPGSLSSTELEELVAFAEVVLEGRALAPAEREYVVQHIEERTRRSPEYFSLYRTTARTLERLAGRRAASLDLRERSEFVARHRLGDPRISPNEDLGPFAEQVRAVRKRAVPDLIEGYYRSPAGWAVIGYTVFPGRCGDLMRYTRPES